MDRKAEVKVILKKEGIRDFDQDIRRMSLKELQKNFRFKTRRKKINFTNLLKNMVWQAYTWMQSGKMEKVDGNIRSFWYQNIKSVLSRVGANVNERKYLDKLYDVFVEMTIELRLFRYVDLGFIDGAKERRVIGKSNGNLLLFVEKKGMTSLVKEMAMKYDATGVALIGFPSFMETEFLVRKMAKQGLLREPVHLFGVVDYDPSGYWIEKEFISQLEGYKVEIAQVHSLIKPEMVPKKDLNDYKYRLKKGTKTDNWMELKNGIDGEAYGLEADILKSRRIKEAFDKALKPYVERSCARMIALDEQRDSFFRELAEETPYEIEEKGYSRLEDLADSIDALEEGERARLKEILKERKFL